MTLSLLVLHGQRKRLLMFFKQNRRKKANKWAVLTTVHS